MTAPTGRGRLRRRGSRRTAEFLGSDGDGTWIALRVAHGADDIEVARSADDGKTWTTLAASLPAPPDGDLVDARVRGAGATWIAAWTVKPAHASDQAEVVITRSENSGLAWGKSKAMTVADDVGARGFALETDGAGTWVAMLADTGLRFLRSSDDGGSWKAPTPVVEGAVCESCAAQWRFTQVGLATDGKGKWAAIFAAFLLDDEADGRDGDVFVVRSSNHAATWSAPVAVAPWSAADGSPDFEPSIATNGSGTWLAAWVTHHPFSEEDDLDSDVVTAVSKDGGATWSTPSPLSTAMATDAASDRRSGVVATGSGHWLALWERHDFRQPDGWPCGDLLVAAADATCGNGVLEVGESCDDANTTDDDGCDSDCTAGGCGNGRRNAGEECDDGNRDDHDACTTACRLPSCGDAILSNGEQCDDGNTADNDACRNNCGVAGCGDGVVHEGYETCDEGGRSSTTCTPDCRLPRCGDGFVAAWGEACDDGNTVDGDACPNDCSRAICGDGQTSLGWEECDPADPMWASQCTASCLLIDVCGDANADGKVTSGDARVVLRKAVGLDADCPRAACDMNSNGRISASDALIDLRVAVGIPVGERCSIGTGTIVFWVETMAAIGSFQIDIDYSSTGGEFAGSGSGVSCETFREGSDVFLAAFRDDEAHWILTAGVVALETFTGPLDLFHCEFLMPKERSGARFAVRVVDATDPDGETVSPLPLVGYRVE
jgi:cysteine-rich repeat protein